MLSASDDDMWAWCAQLARDNVQVWQQKFWMQLHGSPTPKPTLCLSNAAWIHGLDLGKLTKETRDKKTAFKTTRQILSIVRSVYCTT